MDKEIAVLIGTGSIGVAIIRRTGVGRSIMLADYNETALNTAAQQLRDEGYDVATQVTDVSDRGAVVALADAAAALGPVTRVVHAAGVSPVQASTERVLQVDLLGTALVLEEFGRIIAPGGAGVVVSSMAGYMGEGYPRGVERLWSFTPTSELLDLPSLAPEVVGDSREAYILAKRANSLRVQAAAVTWGEREARVNSLSPGIISTPLAKEEMSGPNAEGYHHMIATSAAKRIGTPTDVAGAAALLLGSEGTFITGADLLIDGGVIAAMRAEEGTAQQQG